ncbi:MAG: hypothetical protein LBC98_04135 [Prevotellaceae bacterium]|jgi:tetratricopeptide (TPR) repeat protein|nr:hypothetical protein [Prevotellaceae bacterium]
MKKILFALGLFCSVSAFSQGFDKKLASSDKEIGDVKKKENPKTWIARGQLFYDIAAEPTKGLWTEMSNMEYTLLASSLGKPTQETDEDLNGKRYHVAVFPDKKIYFNEDKAVAFWDITKYAAADPLKTSYEAYMQAIKLDPEKKNSKKIIEGLKNLAILSKSQGSNDFQLGRIREALAEFELSMECSSNPLVGETDSMIIYYAGFFAMELKDYPKAEKYLRKAIEINYTGNGDAFGTLAQALNAQDKKSEATEILQKGMTVNPENQQIMIEVINSYMSSGKDPREIMPLLNKAQEAQPTNASLFYAEGNLYEKLYEAGDKEVKDNYKSAEKCYKKSIEIDPEYFLGYYSAAALTFNEGVYYNEQANKVPPSKNEEYERLNKIANEYFKAAMPYFNKAYELNSTEKSVVQALKDINFRFRNDSEEYKQNAEKFREILESME